MSTSSSVGGAWVTSPTSAAPTDAAAERRPAPTMNTCARTPLGLSSWRMRSIAATPGASGSPERVSATRVGT